jgi:signal transduction histidine kinase
LISIALGLFGGLAITLLLYRRAASAIDRVLDERLEGAGESAAFLLGSEAPTSAKLKAIMDLNGLDAAFVVSDDFTVVLDASSGEHKTVDLLRTDSERLERALAGRASVGPAYVLGALPVIAGYFPLRTSTGGASRRALVLEAGRAFQSARDELRGARDAGLALSLVTAVALALIALRWSRAEALARTSAERAAEVRAMAQMASMAAHEIKNPLGVIRASTELMRERSGAVLSDRDRETLNDVLSEVDRLRGLTDDFLDLSRDRPLAIARTNVSSILDEAARATKTASPNVVLTVDVAPDLCVDGDEARLGQVFRNLLANAAQADPNGTIAIDGKREGSRIRILVRDRGPGIAESIRERLFDPFVTTRAQGTGLGLAISRRHVERHGGSIRLLETSGEPGACFEVVLPAAAPSIV